MHVLATRDADPEPIASNCKRACMQPNDSACAAAASSNSSSHRRLRSEQPESKVEIKIYFILLVNAFMNVYKLKAESDAYTYLYVKFAAMVLRVVRVCVSLLAARDHTRCICRWRVDYRVCRQDNSKLMEQQQRRQ